MPPCVTCDGQMAAPDGGGAALSVRSGYAALQLLSDSSSNSYRTEVTLSLPEVKSPGEVRTKSLHRYGFIELFRSYRQKGAGASGYGKKSMSG